MRMSPDRKRWSSRRRFQTLDRIEKNKIVLYHSCYNLACVICLLWFNTASAVEEAFYAADTGKTAGCVLSRKSVPALKFARFILKTVSSIKTSPTAVSLAMYYIYRLGHAMHEVPSQRLSEYQVFAGSLILASKYLDDPSYKTKSWADTLDINTETLSAVELYVFASLGFQLYMSREQFTKWSILTERLLALHHKMFGASLRYDNPHESQTRAEGQVSPRAK